MSDAALTRQVPGWIIPDSVREWVANTRPGLTGAELDAALRRKAHEHGDCPGAPVCAACRLERRLERQPVDPASIPGPGEFRSYMPDVQFQRPGKLPQDTTTVEVEFEKDGSVTIGHAVQSDYYQGTTDVTVTLSADEFEQIVAIRNALKTQGGPAA